MHQPIYVVAFRAEQRVGLDNALLAHAITATSFEAPDAFLADATAGRGCVVVAADLPDAGAMRVIDELGRRRSRIAVVVVGCDHDLASAVAFVRAGAAEFVEPPVRAGRLVNAVHRALAGARKNPSP